MHGRRLGRQLVHGSTRAARIIDRSVGRGRRRERVPDGTPLPLFPRLPLQRITRFGVGKEKGEALCKQRATAAETDDDSCIQVPRLSSPPPSLCAMPFVYGPRVSIAARWGKVGEREGEKE